MKKHVGFVSRHFQCFQSVYTELVDCEKLFKMGNKVLGTECVKLRIRKCILRRKTTCFFKKKIQYTFSPKVNKKERKKIFFWGYYIMEYILVCMI